MGETPFFAVSALQPERTPISQDIDTLREQLVTLAISCPHTKSNPSSCPLHEVRKLESAAILDWLDGLSREDLDYLTLYHQCCLVTKWESERNEKKIKNQTRRRARRRQLHKTSGG